MFNDRDLTILGAGALGAILCLMLPWTFAAKVVVAVLILIMAMALAFARFGLDRLTLEQYLKRQLVFAFQPRRYSYFNKSKPVVNKSVGQHVASVSVPQVRPLSFNLDNKGMYWLMLVWMIVIGAYVLYWAYSTDGLKDAAFWVRHFIMK